MIFINLILKKKSFFHFEAINFTKKSNEREIFKILIKKFNCGTKIVN